MQLSSYFEGAKKDLFKAFDFYETRGNMIYCALTRSLIMELFRDHEVHKDLFGVKSVNSQQLSVITVTVKGFNP